jgi:signal transduction histidine kinase
MGERTQIKPGLRARPGLRAKLVRAMVVTLVIVTGATVLTVGYMNYRSARATLETIETQIRQSIARKGQGLATNHAMALRGLVADNAFGDVARLVERSVQEDEEMLYGLFLGADGRVWTYVPPAVLSRDPRSRPDFKDLGIDPVAAGRPGAEATKRDVAGQEAFEFSASVAADDGAVLGRIFYGLSSVPLKRALSDAREEFQRTLLLTLMLLSVLGIAATLLGITIVRGVAARITRPLVHLTDVTTAIADGRKDQRVSIASDDEIGDLGRAFNQMLQELDESYKKLESLNRTLEHRVETRTRELGQRNRDMRLVLDNVNQGFLTMSREGVLAEERSAIVTRWLGASAPNQRFVAYIGRHDQGFAEAFQLGWEVLLEGLLPLELCLTQLPKRLHHDGRELEFSYHAIQEQGVDRRTLYGTGGILRGLLIVVNDITEQVTHARQEADRAELLAMVQGFMTDRSGFLAFFDEVTHLLESYRDPDSDLITRKRVLHTIKGNAGLAGFRVVSDLCHQAEEQLADGGEAQAEDTIRALLERWHTLDDTLATLLGERGRDIVEVQVGELAGVIEDLRSAGTPNRITSQLAGWTLEPVERPLGRLARYARSLAQRLGKGEIHVDVDGGGVRVDPQRWKGLWSELVHVVRNAVDHGMEAPDERRGTSKPLQPRLRLRTAAAGERLIIDIDDDGRGIDWDALRAIAQGKGLPCASPEELTAVLLAPDITTRSQVTLTSGRGMGLASVADRVRELGGNIAVKSRTGHGTQFRVSLPLTAGAPIRTEPVPAPAHNIA